VEHYLQVIDSVPHRLSSNTTNQAAPKEGFILANHSVLERAERVRSCFRRRRDLPLGTAERATPMMVVVVDVTKHNNSFDPKKDKCHPGVTMRVSEVRPGLIQ
jgi:hypothetical protein